MIDTWYVYPQDRVSSPFPGNLLIYELKNLIITPHMSGWTRGAIQRRQKMIAENIRRLSKGELGLNNVRGLKR